MNILLSSVFSRQKESFYNVNEKNRIDLILQTLLNFKKIDEIYNDKSLGFKKYKGQTKVNVYGIDLNVRSAERIIATFLDDVDEVKRNKYLKSHYIDKKEKTIILHRISKHDNQSKEAQHVSEITEIDIEELIRMDYTLENAFNMDELYSVVRGNRTISILTENKVNIVDDFVHNNKYPMLLEGIAGSGKTEVIKSILLEWSNTNPDSKILYITASQSLVNEVEKKAFLINRNIQYHTLNSLINSLLNTNKTLLSFSNFEKMFSSNYIDDYQLIRKINLLKEKYSLLRIYGEIHGIILGLNKSNEIRSMSKVEYLNTALNDSITINKNEREVLFDISRLYAMYLGSDYYESNTVCLQLLNTNNKKFDLVLVDEVQDFTDIEFTFIYSLVKNKKQLFITGDPNQTINPTLFDLGNIKSKFFNQSIDLYKYGPLKDNHRNSGVITQLINQLNDIRNKKLTARKIEYTLDEIGQSTINGKIYVYNGPIKYLDKFRTSANVIEIASDLDNIDSRLKVLDVKGLEFDHVIAYNLISDYSDLLDTIFEDSYKKSNSMHYYFNIFYVAISRVIKNLILVEERSSKFLLELISRLENLDLIEIVEDVDQINIDLDESIERIYNNGIKLSHNQMFNPAHRSFELVYQINPYYPKIEILYDYTLKAKKGVSNKELADYLEKNGFYSLAEVHYKLSNQLEKYALMALYQDNNELFEERIMNSNIDLLELYRYANDWQKYLIDVYLTPKINEYFNLSNKLDNLVNEITEKKYGK